MKPYDPPTTKPKQRQFVLDLVNRLEHGVPDPAWVAAELRRLETHMHNRVSDAVRAVSQPVTPAVEQRIVDLKADNPDMPQYIIAVKARVNPGRVSEVLSGKRL